MADCTPTSTGFTQYVYDPLQSNCLPAADNFATLGNAAVYSINFALLFFQIGLIVLVGWFIFKGIYAIIGADSAESFEKFRGAVTNAVFAAVGLALLGGSRFFFVAALNLLGIDNNVFMDGPLKQIFGI